MNATFSQIPLDGPPEPLDTGGDGGEFFSAGPGGKVGEFGGGNFVELATAVENSISVGEIARRWIRVGGLL